MTAVTIDLIGIATADRARSVGFYRSLDPDYAPGNGRHSLSLAVGCGSPAEVDALYARMVGGLIRLAVTSPRSTHRGGSATPCCTTRTASASTFTPRSARSGVDGPAGAGDRLVGHRREQIDQVAVGVAEQH